MDLVLGLHRGTIQGPSRAFDPATAWVRDRDGTTVRAEDLDERRIGRLRAEGVDVTGLLGRGRQPPDDGTQPEPPAG